VVKKDNTGIKGILSIHTPAPAVRVVKKTKPTVQEMLDREDQYNLWDPLWYVPLEIPKTKPTDESKLKQDEIEKDFFQNKLKNIQKVPVKIVKKQKAKSKPMSMVRYIDRMNSLYANDNEAPDSNKFKYTSWSDDKNLERLEPTKAPIENKHGHTRAQKEKMIEDWLTRPPITDAEKAASALWKAKNKK